MSSFILHSFISYYKTQSSAQCQTSLGIVLSLQWTAWCSGHRDWRHGLSVRAAVEFGRRCRGRLFSFWTARIPWRLSGHYLSLRTVCRWGRQCCERFFLPSHLVLLLVMSILAVVPMVSMVSTALPISGPAVFSIGGDISIYHLTSYIPKKKNL